MWDDDEEDVIVDIVSLDDAIETLRAEDEAEIARTLQWNRAQRQQRLN